MPGTRFATFALRSALLGSAALVAGFGMAQAQAVEQHPAPVLHGPQTCVPGSQAGVVAPAQSPLATQPTHTPAGVLHSGVAPAHKV